jgi:hypothetical protein
MIGKLADAFLIGIVLTVLTATGFVIVWFWP